jgi:lysophospholipase L1-like esterase
MLMVFGTPVQSADPSTPAPRDRDYSWMSLKAWHGFHDEHLARIKSGPVDVLFMGDSITHGWQWGGKKTWDKYYGALKPANFGIGGDTTQNVIWRITEGKELDGIQPKLMVLMIGTNNTGAPPEQIAKAIQKIIEISQQKQPQMKILLLAVFPRGEKPEDGGRKAVAKLNELIAKYDNGKTVRYLDIGAKFLQADGVMSKEIMGDFLHPSGKGYEIWAEAMNPLFTEMLK